MSSAIYKRLKISSILLPILVAIGMVAYFAVMIYIFSFVPWIPPFPASSAISYVIVPVVFAFPWILFAFIFRERLINASETMNRRSNLIPMRWRMLYGFNTLVILAFFIFPFISPPLAIFAALVLAYRLVHHSENIWQKSQGARMGYTLVLFVILAIGPIYLTIIWFQYFISSVAITVLLAWISNFDLMYFTSICIVNALAVGALLHLSYGTLDRRGDLEYGDSQKVWLIRFAELSIFVALWFIFNPWFFTGYFFNVAFPDPIGFAGTMGNITYVNYLCLTIIAIVYLVKFIVGIGGSMKLSIIGVLFAASFLVVEILNSFFAAYTPILRSALIVGSSLLFIFAFIISFFAAPDELLVEAELLAEETDSIKKQVLEDAESIEESDEDN